MATGGTITQSSCEPRLPGSNRNGPVDTHSVPGRWKDQHVCNSLNPMVNGDWWTGQALAGRAQHDRPAHRATWRGDAGPLP